MMTEDTKRLRELDAGVGRAFGLDVQEKWRRCFWSPDDGSLEVESDITMSDEVFGTELHPVHVPLYVDPEYRHQPAFWEPVPFFSTDMNEAHKLLTRLQEKHTNLSLHGSSGWGLVCWNIYVRNDRPVESGVVGPVNAKTAAEAICLTFLEAYKEK